MLNDGIYLVDIDVDVKSIIVNMNVIFVFNDVDFLVCMCYILVCGEFYLGLENCKFISNIDIIFYGEFDKKNFIELYIFFFFNKNN